MKTSSSTPNMGKDSAFVMNKLRNQNEKLREELKDLT
jgi:hypothetical protein